MLDRLSQWWARMQFGVSQQRAFLEDLTSLIKDGVPANQAVDTIAKISEGITQAVAESIVHALGKGKGLADGMDGWFDRPTIEVVKAGEASGTLERAIEAAIESSKTEGGAVGAVITGLLYPVTVLVASLTMIIFIKNSVLVNFADIKPVADWPGIGQTIYHVGDFMQHWWWVAVSALVAFILMSAKLLQYLTGDTRILLDHMPIIRLYRERIASRFMETLGLLISNGIVLKQALSIIHRDAPPYLAWHLLMMEFRLGNGRENIADVLDTQLISQSDILRLRVIARGKGLEHALLSLGRQANVRSGQAVERLGKILGGLILGIGAGMAAMMVFGIYTVGSAVAT